MVSTHLKNISQIGSFPQIGMKIKNVSTHHLARGFSSPNTDPAFRDLREKAKVRPVAVRPSPRLLVLLLFVVVEGLQLIFLDAHVDRYHSLVGGFNPSEKYKSNWIIFPGRGEHKKCLKPPASSYKWGYWGYKPLIPTFDPNFLGHPSSCINNRFLQPF